MVRRLLKGLALVGMLSVAGNSFANEPSEEHCKKHPKDKKCQHKGHKGEHDKGEHAEEPKAAAPAHEEKQ